MKVVLRQTQFDHEPVRRAIFHRIEWSSSCTWGMAVAREMETLARTLAASQYHERGVGCNSPHSSEFSSVLRGIA